MSLTATVAERRRLSVSPDVARAIRESAGVTQEEIAAELGVHRVTIGRWETGARRPRGEYLRRYARLIEDLRQVAS